MVSSMIKIARDIDLLEHKNIGVVHIVHTECLTKENFKDLIAFETDNFDEAVTQYACNICDTHCSQENPIYTNNSHQGIDICSNCIKKALETVKEMPGWNPGPVYSLKEICNAVKPSV